MILGEELLHLEAAVKLLKSKKKVRGLDPKDKKVRGLDPKDKKAWLKMIKTIECPYQIEALIIELEARKQQLDPDFKSETIAR